MVDLLYANVDVSARLQQELPPNLSGLAGPIAGLSREVADRAARRLLARPRVQDVFVTALALTQKQFIAVLHGDTRLLETTNGKVVLDLRPLVLQLGNRFNLVSNLAGNLPAGSAQVTILGADQLSAAQDITHLLESIANWVWVLAVAAWVAAIWLARGRRREEVRALGVGLILVGLLVLLVRRLAGGYFVDHLVVNDSVRPAASDAWEIITQSLADSGWVALSVGVLVTLGAWLTGPRRRAVATRVGLAPLLRRRDVAWALFALVVILVIWVLPIQSFRVTMILVVAATIGFVVLQRQVAAEVPEGAVPDLAGAVRGRVAAIRSGLGAGPSSPTDELERLARLKENGHLSEEEYATAKARLLGS